MLRLFYFLQLVFCELLRSNKPIYFTKTLKSVRVLLVPINHEYQNSTVDTFNNLILGKYVVSLKLISDFLL